MRERLGVIGEGGRRSRQLLYIHLIYITGFHRPVDVYVKS